MSFCPKCGRQLSDGEVCNCQAQNTQQVQPDAQTQSIQQVQPDAQTQSTQQAPKQTSPMVKELTDLLSGIFKKPADAVKKYVSNASMEAPAILILVLAFISALGELLRMLYIKLTFIDFAICKEIYFYDFHFLQLYDIPDSLIL